MTKPNAATKPYASRFPQTHKSAVIRAGQGATTERHLALSEICKLYWPPLYAVARSRGHSADKACDLTQGFFTKLVEKNYIATFDPDRGKFRNWLWGCFKHYLNNCWNKEPDSGGHTHVSLDGADAVDGERFEHAELANYRTAAALFQRDYTLALLRRAQDTLKEEWADKGRARQFDKLASFTTYESGERYKLIAEELKTSETAVKAEVCRLRERFFELIRIEVAKTVPRPEDVDAELMDLLMALTNEPSHPIEAGAHCTRRQQC